jgi:hypothetical protein
VFAVLMAGAFVGVVGVLPYALTLLDRVPGSSEDALPPWWLLVPLQVVQAMVLLAAATALGLWLGPKVGLGAPMLYGLVRGERAARSGLRALLLPSAVLGTLVGVAIALLDLWAFGPRLTVAGSGTGSLQPSAWQGLLASFYGAIPEELLLRLGLMTLFVWIGARLTRASGVATAATPRGPRRLGVPPVTASPLSAGGHRDGAR